MRRAQSLRVHTESLEIDMVAVGTYGDVLPFIALGDALLARGHRVRLAAPAPFEGMVGRTRIGFEPLGTTADYDALVDHPDMWHPIRGVTPILTYSQRMAEPTLKWLGTAGDGAGRRVVVASPLGWGARLAQDLYGLPTATLHVMPFLIESRYAPPRLPGLPLPRLLPTAWRAAVNKGADDVVIGPAILPALNALRERLGLRRVRRLRYWWNSPERLLLMFPDWYAESQADWPSQAVQLGFPAADRFGDRPDLPADLEAFLAAGAPPLVFSYGSAMRQAQAFFRTAVGLCERMGRRGVLLAPQDGQAPASLPEGVIHLPYAPLGALLPRSAALIHHGGVGTLAQALAAGVPQLIVPYACNHFDDGVRIHQKHLGAMLSRRRFTPTGAARVLERMLADPRVIHACRVARARMARGGDVIAGACDEIEALAGRRAALSRAA